MGYQQANPRLEAAGYGVLSLLCFVVGFITIIRREITLSLDESNSDHRNREPRKYTGPIAIGLGVTIIVLGGFILARGLAV